MEQSYHRTVYRARGVRTGCDRVVIRCPLRGDGSQRVIRSVGLDRSYASRIFRRHYNETIQRYLIRRRIERAVTLVREGALRVTEVPR